MTEIEKTAKCPRCGAPNRFIDKATTGASMRAAREHLGLSLRLVATYAKMSPAYASALELGQRGWTEDLVQRYRSAITEAVAKR
jgi:hypothetical protein